MHKPFWTAPLARAAAASKPNSDEKSIGLKIIEIYFAFLRLVQIEKQTEG